MKAFRRPSTASYPDRSGSAGHLVSCGRYPLEPEWWRAHRRLRSCASALVEQHASTYHASEALLESLAACDLTAIRPRDGAQECLKSAPVPDILLGMKGLSDIVTSTEEILSGTPVFTGTRVPVQNLIDCLESGDSIDLFLYDFPTVKREQVIAVLEAVKREMLEAVPA